jgi:hypothetical protein
MTPLQIAANKYYGDGYGIIAKETLDKFPEGEWFEPTNGEGRDFTVCSELQQVALVAVQRMPIWKDGSIRGVEILFKYRHDLKYNQEINP